MAHFVLCKRRRLCYTLPACEHRFRLFLGSSAVEHSTVNRMVAGSNPARGASHLRPRSRLFAPLLKSVKKPCKIGISWHLCAPRRFVTVRRRRQVFRVSKQGIAAKQGIDRVRLMGGGMKQILTDSALRGLKPREARFKLMDGGILRHSASPRCRGARGTPSREGEGEGGDMRKGLDGLATPIRELLPWARKARDFCQELSKVQRPNAYGRRLSRSGLLCRLASLACSNPCCRSPKNCNSAQAGILQFVGAPIDAIILPISCHGIATAIA